MGPTDLLPLRRKACWGFFRPKNSTASAGCEPANLGTKGQHAISRPPTPLNKCINKWSQERKQWPSQCHRKRRQANYEQLKLKENVLKDFNVHGSVHRKNILIYVQQDATLHSLFYLETALHVSGGTTTHQQERKQLYLQHLYPLQCDKYQIR